MKRIAFLLLWVVVLVGCDREQSLESSLNQSELEKYVQENPVALVGEEDTKALNEVAK